MTLPKRYVDDVRNAPHVKAATWANWFGGKDPKHDRRVLRHASPSTRRRYFEVYDEMQRRRPTRCETWLHDPQGAIVGDVLAAEDGLEGRRQGHARERHLPGRLAVQHRRHLHGDGALGRPVDVLLPLGLPERRAATRAARPGRAGSSAASTSPSAAAGHRRRDRQDVRRPRDPDALARTSARFTRVVPRDVLGGPHGDGRHLARSSSSS